MTAASSELADRVALVTGASRGIGAATAQALADAGARLVLAARDVDAMGRVAEQITGGDVLVVRTDLRDPDALRELVDAVDARFGRLDILVNNAGLLPDACRVERIDPETWHHAMALNVTAPWQLSSLARPLMSAGGVVVNVASTAALYPSRGLAAYNVSKAALVMLTRVCALEWAREGIRVVCVAPGKVATEMVQPILEYLDRRGEPVNPLGRVAEPEEVARLIRYLVGDGASYITGTILTIDGGEVIGTG